MYSVTSTKNGDWFPVHDAPAPDDAIDNQNSEGLFLGHVSDEAIRFAAYQWSCTVWEYSPFAPYLDKCKPDIHKDMMQLTRKECFEVLNASNLFEWATAIVRLHLDLLPSD